MNRRMLSLLLSLALIIGISNPCYGADNHDVPMFFVWNQAAVLGEVSIKISKDGVLRSYEATQMLAGSIVTLKPNPNFTTGIVQSVSVQALHSGTEIYFYQRQDGDVTPPPQITITFDNDVAIGAQTVSLADPEEVYSLNVMSTSLTGDQNPKKSWRYLKIGPLTDDSLLIETSSDEDFVITDGVLTKYRGQASSVTIPAGVTTIGVDAFARNKRLSSVSIPSTVKNISSFAFQSCSKLKEIVIPDSVTEIGEWSFSGCEALEKVVIGAGITEIADGAFAGCSNLNQVTFGQNVAYIGDAAFRECSALTSLELPESVCYVDFSAFEDCSALSQIKIPDTTIIARMDSVFSGCELLELPTQPQERDTDGTVVSFSAYTTDSAYGLVFLRLCKNGTAYAIKEEIGFDEWDYRKDYTLYEFMRDTGEYGQKTFSYFRENASNELVIPEGVRAIEALLDYGEIERLVLPRSLQVIGMGNRILSPHAFGANTNLKEVVFPAPEEASPSLKYQDLGKHFSDCLGLERIINCPDQTILDRVATNQKIEAAWKAIDPRTCIEPQSERITTLSNRICAGYATDYEKAKAIFDWVTANIVYDYDYYMGRKSTVTILPEEVLDSKLTVCDGYSRLTQALLLAQKIPTVYIAGTANNGSGSVRNGSQWIGHAWNMAYIDGRWIYIDSTWGRPGSYDGNSYGYNPGWFDTPLLALSISHVGESSQAPNYSSTPLPPALADAVSNRSTVLVNGEKVAFDAYTINGNNYFKLRDLAKVLSGTNKQFEVTWDGARNTINLVSNKPYTVVGGELTQGDGTTKTGQVNTSTIYLDGQPVYLTAYTINGNNYFKLRDVGQTFDFDVSWDGANNTIMIDTAHSYTAD